MTTAVNEPNAVGTPETMPVAALMPTPGGSEPEVTDQSTDPTCPAAVITTSIGSADAAHRAAAESAAVNGGARRSA